LDYDVNGWRMEVCDKIPGNELYGPGRKENKLASQYIYYWNRIFGALAVLVGLLAGLIYGGYVWLASGDDALEVAQPNTPPIAPTVVGESRGLPLLESEQPLAEQQDELTPQSEDQVPVEADPRAEVGAAPSAWESLKAPGQDPLVLVEVDEYFAEASPTSEAEPPPEEAERIAGSAGSSDPGLAEPADAELPRGSEETLGALETDLLATVVDAASAAITAAANEPLPLAPANQDPSDGPAAQAPEPAPASAIGKAVFEAGNIIVVSPAVQRFSLARDIENREPVSDLNGVRFDANGLATVYAFSEVAGMAGSTFYYHWVHDGKERAVVPVRVEAERWRSHSSKYIEETMTGAWTVQLRDANGKLLAEAEFIFPRQ
jgi:hypothetical protein